MSTWVRILLWRWAILLEQRYHRCIFNQSAPSVLGYLKCYQTISFFYLSTNLQVKFYKSGYFCCLLSTWTNLKSSKWDTQPYSHHTLQLCSETYRLPCASSTWRGSRHGAGCSVIHLNKKENPAYKMYLAISKCIEKGSNYKLLQKWQKFFKFWFVLCKNLIYLYLFFIKIK